MLPAISLDSPLFLMAQKDAYKSDDFLCFIDGLLDAMNQYPADNSVIIMDNASINKDTNVYTRIARPGVAPRDAEMLREVWSGCRWQPATNVENRFGVWCVMPGCRAPIPSKHKQKIGALFCRKRSIEVKPAGKHEW